MGHYFFEINGNMSDNNHKNILWTAQDNLLPQDLWQRLEEMGYKVLVAEGGDNFISMVGKVSPCLWVGEVEGLSGALRRSGPREHAPGLSNRIDAAFLRFVGSPRSTIVVERTPIPGSVPAILLDGSLEFDPSLPPVVCELRFAAQ